MLRIIPCVQAKATTQLALGKELLQLDVQVVPLGPPPPQLGWGTSPNEGTQSAAPLPRHSLFAPPATVCPEAPIGPALPGAAPEQWLQPLRPVAWVAARSHNRVDVIAVCPETNCGWVGWAGKAAREGAGGAR